MSSEVQRLQAAFVQKEQNQNFLANLEKLKMQGSVKDEQYKAMKAGYQEKLTAAVSEIASIKSQLKNKLHTSEQKLVSLRAKLETLTAEYKAGRLTDQKYHGSHKELTREIERTDTLIAELRRLIAAKSSAETAAIPQEVGISPSLLAKKEMISEAGAISREKVKLSYLGKGEDILGRVILWGILSVVTLGIYQAWAINHLYRYIIEHVEVASQNKVNLRYTGRGEDIFGRIILWGILTVVTFGIYSPWAITNLYRYIIEHTKVEVY